MGEAKRRKQFDPNFGKPRFAVKVKETPEHDDTQEILNALDTEDCPFAQCVEVLDKSSGRCSELVVCVIREQGESFIDLQYSTDELWVSKQVQTLMPLCIQAVEDWARAEGMSDTANYFSKTAHYFKAKKPTVTTLHEKLQVPIRTIES